MKMITNLAWSNIKKDRTRSILIISSIVLTTILLTMIFTMGYGTIKANKDNVGIWYGDYYGTYKNMTEGQIEQMRLRSEFTAIGKTDLFGMVDSDRDLYLVWSDNVYKEMKHMEDQLLEGHFPETGNEIAAQPNFFRSLGVENPQIGDTVTVPWRLDLSDVFEPEEFVIRGLLKEPEILSSSAAAQVSEEYFTEHVAAEERYYKVYFRMDESLDITSDNALSVMEEIGAKLGVDSRYVDDNAIYLMWKLNPGIETISFCAIIAIVVVCFAVIVIYNIFQVGIVQKVQEYGKLKAIGATRKQMKGVVYREGMLLAAVAVPVGMILGYILSLGAFRWLMDLMDTSGMPQGRVETSLFCLPLLLLAGVLAIIAVWIALKKPMKIVAAISPVEAMRYQESSNRKNGMRKGKMALSVTGLTFANMSGHKRRTISTILSMGLSCVLFVVIANFMGNMDMKYAARTHVPWGQFEIGLDYSLLDTAYPENNLDSILSSNPLNPEFVDEIKAMDKVTGVENVNILYVSKLDEAGNDTGEKFSVLVLDRDDFAKEYEAGGTLGEFDYDEVTASNGVIYGWSYFMEDNGYTIGQELSMSGFDGENTKEFGTKICGAFGSVEGNFVMTQDTYETLGFSDTAICAVRVDCNESDAETVRGELQELMAGKEHIGLKSYLDELKGMKANIRVMKVGGYMVCLMIAFISFMNMANTMITSIVTRKQEFGILQALGMTNHQLNSSLQLEGIFFTLGPVLISMIVGIPLGYAAFCYGKSNSIIGLYTYHFPLVEILCMVVLLAAMQIILSYILSRNVKKESLVERIRYQE